MALGRLPILGTLTYGDFEFGPETQTLSYSITPVYDTAKRTIVFSRWSIQLRTWIEGTPADNAVRRAVAQLTRPADVLLMFDRGTPSLKVNLHDQRDAEYGPRPQMVSVKAHGNRTTEITWSVEFSLATCDDRIYNGLMEFNFKLKFDIDSAGLTTRTYSGHIKIATTRKTPTSRKLEDSADAYREQVIPPLLVGFRRISQSWELDEAKTKATFSVVDKAFPKNAPPGGVLEWSGSHTCSTRAPGGLQWLWHLESEYTMSPANSDDIILATGHFARLLQDRIETAKKMVGVGGGGPVPGGFFGGLPRVVGGAGGAGPAVKVVPIPWAFSVSEPDLSGLTKARFSVSYTFAGVPLSEILRSSGLWLPVRETHSNLRLNSAVYHKDWQEFQKEFNGPRGAHRLVFRLSDDRIVDLCARGGTGGVIPPPTSRDVAPPPRVRTVAPPPRAIGGESPFKPPGASSSWIGYKVDTHVWVDSGAVVAKALPTTPISTAQFQSPSGRWDVGQGVSLAPNSDRSAYSPASASLSGTNGNIQVQQRTGATLYIAVSGFALRAGWTIPTPVLTSVNGVMPVLVNDPTGGPTGIEQGVIRDVGFGIPIYGAKWRMVYALPETPRGRIEPLPSSNLA